MKDIAGNTLKKGDLIVYASSIVGASYPRLVFAKFLSIEKVKKHMWTDVKANIIAANGMNSHSYIGPYERILVVKRSAVPKRILKTLDAVDVNDPKNYPKKKALK